MGHGVQFIVLNSDEQFRKELRTMLLGFEGVRIAAEVEEPALLKQAVEQFNVDIILVNLDPSPDAVLPIAGEIASNRTDLAVFAVSTNTQADLILKALRMGLREFLPRPIEVEALGEAIEKVANTKVTNVSRGRLITVNSASGGSGATMLASNLAVELAEMCAGRVTLVDLDYRCGQVATFLDVDTLYSIADLTNSPEQLEQQVIERALVKHGSGVWVLSRPATIEQADGITASACVGLLSALLQFSDYVVTDGPTRFDLGGQSIFDFSDLNLLLVQLLVPNVRAALRHVESLRETGANLERWQLIFNRMGLESAHLDVKDATETIGLPCFAQVPDEWSTVSGAINLGEPLMSASPKSKVRTAIREIAGRLHTPKGDSDESDNEKKGLFGKLLARS